MRIPSLLERRVSKEAIKQIEGPVGRLILGFASIDHHLDFLLMATFKKAERAGIARNIPHQFRDKVGLLQRCFEELPELRSRADDALALLDKVDALNGVRNTIVHGALSHSSPDPEPALVLVRLRHSKADQVYKMRDEVLTFAAIVSAAEEVGDLILQLTVLANDLQDQAWSNRPND